MSVKDKITIGVTNLLSIIPTPRKSNEAKFYQDIYVWQELSDLADTRLKAAWKNAQDEGIIESDEDMRDLGEGAHIVCESGNFSCTAKVAAPGSRFDKDAFVELAAKELKVKPQRILDLIAKATKQNKAALTKRILEA